jgi:Na+-transporting NADH:ubiquinone oxidoreductase subunit NqrD
MGVCPLLSLYLTVFLANLLTITNSITRLMGESFALHSQALVGYVDDISISSDISAQSPASLPDGENAY